MTDRLEIDGLLRGLYAARLRGDLDAVCRSFSDDAVFQIAGAGQVSPVSNRAVGVGEFRPLLAVMIKTFKLRDQVILAILIDGMKAAVHWRAGVYSRITGTMALTEFVAIVEVRDGRIVSYLEFFAPRS
ncbi:MAG TPA: nuclear transport factor 2 family protein [Xanthobacteraceae bacterium]|nr:nuclear transport factor 2 family protein [Xanthobacteraceae bacterium]